MIPNFAEGNCRDADTELFFPASNDISGGRQIIRVYCKTCPIMAECLEWALEMEGQAGHSGRSGIYGGTTPRQRAGIYRKRREDGKVIETVKPIRHGTEAGAQAHRRRGETPCRACLDGTKQERELREARKPRKPCSVEDCSTPVHAKGVCMRHYEALRSAA